MVTDGRRYGRTDGQTLVYRDARTHLKRHIHLIKVKLVGGSCPVHAVSFDVASRDVDGVVSRALQFLLMTSGGNHFRNISSTTTKQQTRVIQGRDFRPRRRFDTAVEVFLKRFLEF